MERSNSLEAVIDSTGRTRIWSDALAAVAKKPVIGYGPEGYLHSRCCLRDTSQPHNAVVQLLIEVGVLGLAVVCWLLWRTLGRDALQYWRDRGTMRIDPCRAMLFATMGGMTAFALVDGLYYHVVPLTMFAIIAALYASQAPARQIPAPV
jgi:O-antigen ligase